MTGDPRLEFEYALKDYLQIAIIEYNKQISIELISEALSYLEEQGYEITIDRGEPLK